MKTGDDSTRRIAAVLGFCGVAFGAFGAHLFRGILERLSTAQIWQTAVLYHLVHSVVLLVLSGWRPAPRFAFYLVLTGVLIFSGSLYALALTNIKWLGAMTPVGGICLLAGWLILAMAKRSLKG